MMVASLLRLLAAITAVLCLCSEAAGQATRPAPARWQQVVEVLGASAADEDSLSPLLSDRCVIRAFGNDRDSDIKTVLGFLAGRTVLGVHTYIYPPQMMAPDIAADVGASPLVPDSVKADVALDDPIARSAASAVAVKWAQLALGAGSGTPVGVIVLWDGRSGRDEPRLGFILVKGRDVDGEFRITTILWGDPVR